MVGTTEFDVVDIKGTLGGPDAGKAAQAGCAQPGVATGRIS